MMKTILIFGAGKSATSLIDYLCEISRADDLKILVCDANLPLARSKIAGCDRASAEPVDVNDPGSRSRLIRQADVVTSMLPPALHFLVAGDCLEAGKHLLTASYIDENLRTLQQRISDRGLLFLCEMGLDPGIDHMSAMKMIRKIRGTGARILSFRSHCGGLVAPESDDNPWHYKFTWNPSNVIMAGASGAIFRKDGVTTTLSYDQIFDHNESVDIPGLFPLAWYANRDSLGYINTYGLQEAETFVRTTLRHPSFCRGWRQLVAMGLTQTGDGDRIAGCRTYHDWFSLKRTESGILEPVEHWPAEFAEQIDFLGIDSQELVPAGSPHSAAILQAKLENRLAMRPHDRDMIVMLHEIACRQGDQTRTLKSCLVVKGDDERHTAMAKTVGLPLGIAARLLLQGQLRTTGLHIPILPEIYEPVLRELETRGICFRDFHEPFLPAK